MSDDEPISEGTASAGSFHLSDVEEEEVYSYNVSKSKWAPGLSGNTNTESGTVTNVNEATSSSTVVQGQIQSQADNHTLTVTSGVPSSTNFALNVPSQEVQQVVSSEVTVDKDLSTISTKLIDDQNKVSGSQNQTQAVAKQQLSASVTESEAADQQQQTFNNQQTSLNNLSIGQGISTVNPLSKLSHQNLKRERLLDDDDDDVDMSGVKLGPPSKNHISSNSPEYLNSQQFQSNDNDCTNSNLINSANSEAVQNQSELNCNLNSELTTVTTGPPGTNTDINNENLPLPYSDNEDMDYHDEDDEDNVYNFEDESPMYFDELTGAGDSMNFGNTNNSKKPLSESDNQFKDHSLSQQYGNYDNNYDKFRSSSKNNSIKNSGRGGKLSGMNSHKLRYKAMRFPKDVKNEIDRLCSEEVCELTALDKDDACLLLREFKWNVHDLTESWFEDCDKIRKRIGFSEAINDNSLSGTVNNNQQQSNANSEQEQEPVNKAKLANFSTIGGMKGFQNDANMTCTFASAAPINKDIKSDYFTCTVCFDSFPRSKQTLNQNQNQICSEANDSMTNLESNYNLNDRIFKLNCGHEFCDDCWKSHLTVGVADGNTCLSLTCMEPKCGERVRWSLFRKFCDVENANKAETFITKSFIDFNPLCKWCPTADCPAVLVAKEPVRTIETVPYAAVGEETAAKKIEDKKKRKEEKKERRERLRQQKGNLLRDKRFELQQQEWQSKSQTYNLDNIKGDNVQTVQPGSTSSSSTVTAATVQTGPKNGKSGYTNSKLMALKLINTTQIKEIGSGSATTNNNTDASTYSVIGEDGQRWRITKETSSDSNNVNHNDITNTRPAPGQKGAASGKQQQGQYQQYQNWHGGPGPLPIGKDGRKRGGQFMHQILRANGQDITNDNIAEKGPGRFKGKNNNGKGNLNQNLNNATVTANNNVNATAVQAVTADNTDNTVIPRNLAGVLQRIGLITGTNGSKKKVEKKEDDEFDPKKDSLLIDLPPNPLACKEVQCSVCELKWCFACNQEAHRGLFCNIVLEWMKKNADEAENVTWIIANTKPCPQCRNPIEKNLGCMHVTCRCGHQFCWLCLADDKNYQHTRDGRPCNKFMEPDTEKEISRKKLARYAHFFDRFKAHDQSQQIATKKTLRDVRLKMEDLQRIFGNWEDVLFLEEAIKQVIDCRRMLKWTYAFGYFLGKSSTLFEFQQGQLEQKVDQLQSLFESSVFIRRDLQLDFDLNQVSVVMSSSSSTSNETSNLQGSSASSSSAASKTATASSGKRAINNSTSSSSSSSLSSSSLSDNISLDVARLKFMEWKAELTNLTKVVNSFFENINDFFEKDFFDNLDSDDDEEEDSDGYDDGEEVEIGKIR